MGPIVWGGNTWLGVTTPKGLTLAGVSKISRAQRRAGAGRGVFTFRDSCYRRAAGAGNETRQSNAANIYFGAGDIDSGRAARQSVQVLGRLIPTCRCSRPMGRPAP
jgi:hypothetical protein